MGRDSSVGIAIGYGLNDPGIESRWGGDIIRTCPDLPWGPPSLLYNGYRVFSGGKERPGRNADPSPLSSAVGHERGELYLYSPYGPYGLYRALVPVQGWPLPLPFYIHNNLRIIWKRKLYLTIYSNMVEKKIKLDLKTTGTENILEPQYDKPDNKQEQDWRCTYKVTQMCVRVTFVTLEKRNRYYIFWVHVSSLGYPARKDPARHYIVICGLRVSTVFFQNYLIKGHEFRCGVGGRE